jgi:hypothetical protein
VTGVRDSGHVDGGGGGLTDPAAGRVAVHARVSTVRAEPPPHRASLSWWPSVERATATAFSGSGARAAVRRKMQPSQETPALPTLALHRGRTVGRSTVAGPPRPPAETCPWRMGPRVGASCVHGRARPPVDATRACARARRSEGEGRAEVLMRDLVGDGDGDGDGGTGTDRRDVPPSALAGVEGGTSGQVMSGGEGVTVHGRWSAGRSGVRLGDGAGPGRGSRLGRGHGLHPGSRQLSVLPVKSLDVRSYRLIKNIPVVIR